MKIKKTMTDKNDKTDQSMETDPGNDLAITNRGEAVPMPSTLTAVQQMIASQSDRWRTTVGTFDGSKKTLTGEMEFLRRFEDAARS